MNKLEKRGTWSVIAFLAIGFIANLFGFELVEQGTDQAIDPPAEVMDPSQLYEGIVTLADLPDKTNCASFYVNGTWDISRTFGVTRPASLPGKGEVEVKFPTARFYASIVIDPVDPDIPLPDQVKKELEVQVLKGEYVVDKYQTFGYFRNDRDPRCPPGKEPQLPTKD